MLDILPMFLCICTFGVLKTRKVEFFKKKHVIVCNPKIKQMNKDINNSIQNTPSAPLCLLGSVFNLKIHFKLHYRVHRSTLFTLVFNINFINEMVKKVFNRKNKFNLIHSLLIWFLRYKLIWLLILSRKRHTKRPLIIVCVFHTMRTTCIAIEVVQIFRSTESFFSTLRLLLYHINDCIMYAVK